MSGRRLGRLLVLLTGLVGLVAACGDRGVGVRKAADMSSLPAATRPVLEVSDIELDHEPAYGTAVRGLPGYVLTTTAALVVETSEGSEPVVSLRSLSDEQVSSLTDALASAGLTSRPVRDEPAGAGPGVQFVVTGDDGSKVVTRRPRPGLSATERAILDDIRRWSAGGRPVRLDAVVALATRGVTASSPDDDRPAWPARSRRLVDGECAEVRGAEAVAVLAKAPASSWRSDGFSTSPFEQDGLAFEVRLRPMLPWETPCPFAAPESPP